MKHLKTYLFAIFVTFASTVIGQTTLDYIVQPPKTVTSAVTYTGNKLDSIDVFTNEMNNQIVIQNRRDRAVYVEITRSSGQLIYERDLGSPVLVVDMSNQTYGKYYLRINGTIVLVTRLK